MKEPEEFNPLANVWPKFTAWVDEVTGSDVGQFSEADLAVLTIARFKATMWLVVAGAFLLLARYFAAMEPQAFPVYAQTMATTYYDAAAKDLFITVATVAATLWAVFLGVLSLFKDSMPIAEDAPLPRDARGVSLINAREKNYWILMNAGAMTICFQTALYFSIVSLLPTAPRWTISISSAIATLLNAISIVPISDYRRRTSEKLRVIQDMMHRRTSRLAIYIKDLQERIATGEPEEVLRRRISRIDRVEQILEGRQRGLQTEATRLERHRKYLTSSISPRMIGAVLLLLQAFLAILTAFPIVTITIALVLTSLFIGILIASRCTFTLVSFGSDMAARSQSSKWN